MWNSRLELLLLVCTLSTYHLVTSFGCLFLVFVTVEFLCLHACHFSFDMPGFYIGLSCLLTVRLDFLVYIPSSSSLFHHLLVEHAGTHYFVSLLAMNFEQNWAIRHALPPVFSKVTSAVCVRDSQFLFQSACWPRVCVSLLMPPEHLVTLRGMLIMLSYLWLIRVLLSDQVWLACSDSLTMRDWFAHRDKEARHKAWNIASKEPSAA